MARSILPPPLARAALDAAAAAGHVLAAAQAGDGALWLRFERRPEGVGGGASALEVWLRRASDEARCYRQTARFKLGHRGVALDAAGRTLVDALCAGLARVEAALSVADEARLFDGTGHVGAGRSLEWLAVREGLKPAARQVVAVAALAATTARARAEGLAVETLEADAFVAGFGTAASSGPTPPRGGVLLYVARTPQAARAAAQAERVLVERQARGARAPGRAVRALGEALGYPACCIDFFLPRRDRPNATLRFAALARTPAAAASRLLCDLREDRALVSHFVCRYDCAPSRRAAAALLDALARHDAAAARALDAGLRGLVVMFRGEGALRLVPAAGAGSGGAYRFAAVERTGDGPRLAAWHAALSRANAVRVPQDGVAWCFLYDGREVLRLDAPPSAVQARLFT